MGLRQREQPGAETASHDDRFHRHIQPLPYVGSIASTFLPPTLIAALAAAHSADPTRPLVTYYDANSAERIELSLATFDNWVSKLVNLYAVELGLEPGDEVVVDLPISWQASVIVAAAWSAGLVVSLQNDTVPALRVVGPAATTEGLAEAAEQDPGQAAQVLACSLGPLGGRFTSPLPTGWLDFAVEVPGQADVILAPVRVSAADPAVRTLTTTWTHGELVGRAATRAREIGLEAGGRLLIDFSQASEVGLLTGLAAPLVTGSSVVLLANARDADWLHIAEQERVTCKRSAAG